MEPLGQGETEFDRHRRIQNNWFAGVQSSQSSATSIIVRPPNSDIDEPSSIPRKKLLTTTSSFLIVNHLFSLTKSDMNGPAIFRKEVIRYFKLHLEMCSTIGAISFHWDKEENQFASIKNKNKRYQFNFQMTIHILHNIFLVWSLVSRDMGKFGISYKMLSIYFTTGYCLCNGLRIFAWLHEKEIVKLMNAHFNFQEKIRGTYVHLNEKIYAEI